MSALPKDAELALVRLHVDLPKMHGFHHFLAIQKPGAKQVRLLHLVHLTVVRFPVGSLGSAARKPPEPRTLAALLRRRRKDLVHHKRRHAGGLVAALIERLHSEATESRQLDLEDLLEHAA